MRSYPFTPATLRSAAAAILVAALPLGLVLAPSSARASEDIDCYPDITVAHASFTRCNLTTALGPGDDTRATLLLLLLDRDGLPPRVPPAPPLPADAVPLLFWSDFRDHLVAPPPKPAPGFADGEGSRCRSNASGAAAFETAVAAASMPDADRDALIQARKDLQPNCSQGFQILSAPPPGSATGQAFATYLGGIGAFYAGKFEDAATDFASLHGTSDAWLGNAADYMVARTQVNALQAGAAFDDVGDLAASSHIDQAAADRALAGLEAYLRDHRTGSYASSARGLVHRVDWLAGRTPALAASYDAVLALPLAQRGVDDAALAEEIADKLLPVAKPGMVHDPILLAALDLAAMRAPDPDMNTANRPAAPRRVDLEAQRADFASAMPLFDFLAANQAYYLEHDPAKVMTLLPDDTRRRGGDHLWFARQVLRGIALEAKGDRNARGFWKELYAAADRPLDQLTIQLALAMHDERAKALDDIFAPGSIVTSPRLRDILLENSADADLLRRQARDDSTPKVERQLALATLLWKEVTRGHVADFVADVAMVPADARTAPADAPGTPLPLGLFMRLEPGEIGCPVLAATAAQLARDPQATRARLCLAEFVRLAGTSWDFAPTLSYDSNARPPAADLGGAPSMFPGKPYDRAATYKAVIADEAAPASDRAFALYRAVLCWAPSGVNDCGGPRRAEGAARGLVQDAQAGLSDVALGQGAGVLVVGATRRAGLRGPDRRPGGVCRGRCAGGDEADDRRCARLQRVLAVGRRASAAGARPGAAPLPAGGRGDGARAGTARLAAAGRAARPRRRCVARRARRHAGVAAGGLR